MKLKIVALSILLAAPLFAQPHIDKPNGFRMTPPRRWTKQPSEHFKVFFVTANQRANLGVTVEGVGQQIGAIAFLDSVEEQMGVANIMEGEEKQLDAEAIKQVGADDGALGVFMRGEGENQLRQLMFVFTKGTRVYTVIITMREAEKETYRQLAKDVMNSFKLM